MFQFSSLPFSYTLSECIGSPIRKSLPITVMCTSTELIAAYHVLLRLLLPRHPPCALNSFFLQFYSSLSSDFIVTLLPTIHFSLSYFY